ncbi:flavin reductase family protein [Dactylosporangium sp. NPDC005572]|uniref:flavin reductase family protein n=1 Tax=Dactylosporangium sp. NPDC005572 TaxID=3156889 RepID=UPI0033A1DCFD
MGSASITEEFRGFMSAYFTGVTIVTSVDAGGRPHGLTCSSLTSVTLDPPTLLVCLDERTGTLRAVRERGAFAVNLLHEGGTPAARLFASASASRFEQVAWRAAATGLPWLVEDAYGVAECDVADLVPVGDHVVVFGLVRQAVLTGGPGGGSGTDRPLLYGRRGFAAGVAGAVR